MRPWLQTVRAKNWTGVSGWGRFHFLFKLGLPVVIAVVAFVIAASIPGSIPPYCVFESQYLPAPWLVVIGLGAFVGGRYFTRLRAPDTQPRVLGPKRQRGSTIVGQLAFFSVFLALAGVWFYEAIGTAHVSSAANGFGGYEPITYYIRCAVYDDRSHLTVAPYTMFVVALICFLAGRWLWSSHKDVPPAPPPDQVSLA